MTDIKLLILDIDGTIAGKSNQVNETVQKVIEKVQNKGIHVALATGRMYRSALRFHYSINGQLPIIAYNGAWIQDPKNGQIYSHIPLPKQIALGLLDYYQKPEWRSQVEVHFYINDQLYVQEITENTQSYIQRAEVNPIELHDLHSLLNVDPTKVLALCHDPNLTEILGTTLRNIYQQKDVYLTQSTAIYLEATHPSVNKGYAVKYLAEKILNLESKQVMAIGDNFNDLEMLKYAGLSVAMKDAPQKVQNQADWVTKTVEEDGVVVAIEKFLL